jgi:hypothetical protein
VVRCHQSRRGDTPGGVGHRYQVRVGRRRVQGRESRVGQGRRGRSRGQCWRASGWASSAELMEEVVVVGGGDSFVDRIVTGRRWRDVGRYLFGRSGMQRSREADSKCQTSGFCRMWLEAGSACRRTFRKFGGCVVYVGLSVSTAGGSSSASSVAVVEAICEVKTAL